jgi:hypothetical protein
LNRVRQYARAFIDIFGRIYTNGKQVYEKVCDITNHQPSVNGNSDYILLHTCWDVNYYKDNIINVGKIKLLLH